MSRALDAAEDFAARATRPGLLVEVKDPRYVAGSVLVDVSIRRDTSEYEGSWLAADDSGWLLSVGWSSPEFGGRSRFLGGTLFASYLPKGQRPVRTARNLWMIDAKHRD